MSSELPYRIYGSQMYHVRVPVCVKSCETCRWAKRAFDQDGSQRGRYKRGQISIVSLLRSPFLAAGETVAATKGGRLIAA
jgi:hypothetical protein